MSYKDTGNLVRIDGKMNAACYQKVLEEDLPSSAWKLHMRRTWTLQHDHDPKHQAKWTCHWLQQKHLKVLEARLSLLTSVSLSLFGEISKPNKLQELEAF